MVYQHGLEGDGYLSPCEKYFWVKIPKCASTYIEKQLIASNWKPSNYRQRLDRNELNYFAVLRNPIDRWISGINEYLIRLGPEIHPRSILAGLETEFVLRLIIMK